MNIKVITADPSHAFTISSIGKQSFRDAFAHLFKNKGELLEYLEFTYHPDKNGEKPGEREQCFLPGFCGKCPGWFCKSEKTFIERTD